MRAALLGAVAVLLLSDAAASSAARSSPLDVVRSHAAFASALDHAAALRRVGARVVAASAPGVELDTHRPAVHVSDALGRTLTVATDEHGAGVMVDSALVLANVAPDTDVVELISAGGAEELRVLHSSRAPSAVRYHVEGASLALSVEHGRVVARDGDGQLAFSADAPYALDARGVRRSLEVTVEKNELVAALDTRGLVYPIVVDPEWKATAPMVVRRQYAAAVRLTSGKILVTGGSVSGTTETSTAELYDEPTGKWTTVAPMKAMRAYHTATLLDDGGVLVTGGSADASPTAETYNPVANTWTVTGAMTGGQRIGAAAAKLGDGRVLVSGGSGPSSTRDDVYNPATRTWTATGLTDLTRVFATAVTLKDGNVLVVGGRNTSGAASYPKLPDLFDAKTSLYVNRATLGAMRDGRSMHTANVLPDGRVLVTGGTDGTKTVTSAELYDPASKTWSVTTGPMVGARTSHTSVQLEGGDVVIIGGINSPAATLASAELFEVASGTFKPFASMTTGRVGFIGALLPSGRVLVAGGTTTDIDTNYTNTAEIVTAFGISKACTANTDCSSNFCVDGVCCNKACNAQCEACDVPSQLGLCQGIEGAPHGTRPKCDKPAGDTCREKACNGIKDVNTCAAYVKDITCKEASCSEESAVGASTCDGNGACVAPSPQPCAPYACNASACVTTCAVKSDCATGFFCKSGACAPEGASCSPDGLSSIGKDGKSTPCNAFRCGGDGLCVDRCVDSSVCADGYICDTTSSQCVAAPAGEGDDGGCGCTTPGTSAPRAAVALAIGAVFAGLLRRRARSKTDRQ